METMSKYFSKYDLEQRKKSEKWVREKAEEFNKTGTLLTFSEWCYRQGKADGRIEVFKELFENIIPTLYENDVDEEVINECKKLLEQIKESENDG